MIMNVFLYSLLAARPKYSSEDTPASYFGVNELRIIVQFIYINLNFFFLLFFLVIMAPSGFKEAEVEAVKQTTNQKNYRILFRLFYKIDAFRDIIKSN